MKLNINPFDLATAATENHTVRAEMFGANLLFLYDSIASPRDTYVKATDILNTTLLRYPGGTISENYFDVTDPNNLNPASAANTFPYNTNNTSVTGPASVVPLGISDFIQFTQEHSSAAMIVLPTQDLYHGDPNASSDEPRKIDEKYLNEIGTFVKNMLLGSYGGTNGHDQVPITFEIGNEYYDAANMTAKEYGLAVNAIAEEISRIFEEVLPGDAVKPQVVIQVGTQWGDQCKFGIYSGLSPEERMIKSNHDIIDSITSTDAMNVITGLVQHYYYNQSGDALDHSSYAMDYLDEIRSIWDAAGYSDRSYSISEWNVSLKSETQFGLMGASVLLEMFKNMIEFGATSACIWPVQGYDNSLFVTDKYGNIQTTAIGESFMMMRESLVGLELLPYTSPQASLEIQTYGSDWKEVLFVSSRTSSSQEVSLDLAQLVDGYSSAVITLLGVESGASWSDPNAEVEISKLDPRAVIQDGHLKVTLAPFEVLKIDFNLLSGFQIVGSDYGQTLLGSNGIDHIFGLGGDDRIVAGGSADLVFAGSGNDTIFGGSGNDFLRGGYGSDFIRSGIGEDRSFGGPGNDRLLGGAGSDFLSGGAGRDMIYGGGGDNAVYDLLGNSVVFAENGSNLVVVGSGRDVISLGNGGNVVFGGLGADIISTGAGDDVLVGDICLSMLGAGDTLSAGAGDDLLSGGGGADIFVFRPNEGSDAIGQFAVDNSSPASSKISSADFQVGIDKIELHGFSDLQSASDVLSHITESSDGYAVFSDNGTEILFWGLSATELTTACFALV